jgi:MFS superfamily sulfate permease-like transporter
VFPQVLSMIPTAALAAVLVYTGYKLINPKEIKHLAAFGRSEVVIYGATLAGIVAFDLLKGVMLGFGLAIFKLLWTFTHMAIRTEHSADGKRLDLFVEGSATFVALPKLAKALEGVPGGVELHVHFEKLAYIDHACLELIHNWRQQHEETGNTVVLEWEELAERYHRPIMSAFDRAIAIDPSVRASARA